MTSAFYLNSYHPLSGTPKGRGAAQAWGLPPFIDGSIRREPDFLSAYPSVTALCRLEKFAPRLHEGDRIIYLTRKGVFPGNPFPARRLVAVLEVCRRFGNHAAASTWYQEQSLPVPANCLIQGNLPAPYEQSSRYQPSYEEWEASYQSRAAQCGIFLACRALRCDVWNPPVVEEDDLMAAFGRIPGTQNPPRITETQYSDLLARVGCSILRPASGEKLGGSHPAAAEAENV